MKQGGIIVVVLVGMLCSWSGVFASAYSDFIGNEFANDPFFANNTTSILDNDYIANNQIGTGVLSTAESSNGALNTLWSDVMGASSTDETIFYVIK